MVANSPPARKVLTTVGALLVLLASVGIVHSGGWSYAFVAALVFVAGMAGLAWLTDRYDSRQHTENREQERQVKDETLKRREENVKHNNHW